MPETEFAEVVARLDRLDENIGELKDLLLSQKMVKEAYTTDEFAKLTGRAEFTVRE